jgi:hypothetical protein
MLLPGSEAIPKARDPLHDESGEYQDRHGNGRAAEKDVIEDC